MPTARVRKNEKTNDFILSVKACMEALEKASTKGDITQFVKFIALLFK